MKSLSVHELFKLLKMVASEVEKKGKAASKRSSVVSSNAGQGQAKTKSSAPKGAVPQQLMKPRAWVEYTLKDALANGWESFSIHQTHKDKETGEKTAEEIEMPASILYNGAYIFKDSVTDAAPNGRQLIHKEAMSLSKQRKAAGHPSYAEFEAQYVPPPKAEPLLESTKEGYSSETSSSKSSITSHVVKKTAAEKEAEREAKKAEKEAEKEAKKAAKEAQKAEKEAEKEAEREAKKAAKEAEKEAKKATTSKAVVTVQKATASTAKAKAEEPEAKADEPEPKAKADEPKKKTVKTASKVVDVPNDGMVHPWTHGGKKYLRNFEGETWAFGADGGIGAWAGLYNAKTDTLDKSATEPAYDEESA